MRTTRRTRIAGVTWLIPLAVALGCFAGCGGNESSRTSAKGPSKEPVEPEAASTWENPTEEECLQLARTLEEAIRTGDTKTFDDAIDWDALLESASGGLPGAEQASRIIVGGIRQPERGGSTLAQVLVLNTFGGGGYRLLRIRQQDGRQRAIFRIAGADSGLNYHEMILVRKPGGQINVVDLYDYASAELFSKELRRSFLPLGPGPSRNLATGLSEMERDRLKHFSQYLELTAAVSAGRGEQALGIYNALPESLQRDKHVLMLRLQASQTVDEPTFAAAIEAFHRCHPNALSPDLVLIDGHITYGQYDEALACIDRLDEAVGGDPYLNVMRAGIHVEMQDYAKAKQLVRQALDTDGTLVDAYWTLASISMLEKDFAETTRLLKTLADRFEIEMADLTTLPDYAEYVKSPHYQQWLDWQRR